MDNYQDIKDQLEQCQGNEVLILLANVMLFCSANGHSRRQLFRFNVNSLILYRLEE